MPGDRPGLRPTRWPGRAADAYAPPSIDGAGVHHATITRYGAGKAWVRLDRLADGVEIGPMTCSTAAKWAPGAHVMVAFVEGRVDDPVIVNTGGCCTRPVIDAYLADGSAGPGAALSDHAAARTPSAGWTTVPAADLADGWTTPGPAPLAYRQTAGRVELAGTLEVAEGPAVGYVAALPGVHPSRPVTAAAVATATVYTGVEAVVVTVTPAGHLVIAAAGAVPAPVAVHLDGCTFPLDAP